MRCLVTGGSGFIGLHLAERLASLGHSVTILDTLNPAKTKPIPGIAYYCRSILHPLNFSCDWVFHLAAKADVIPSIKNPWLYNKVNVAGTVNLLKYCARFGVKRFIYASSTSIYGIPGEYPTPETAPADPQYPYALTKYVAEQYVMHWGKVYKLPVVSLRITTAYGPRMRSTGYGSVFKVFMAQKANNAPFTVVGDGSNARDFVWVGDIVDAFIRAAGSDIQGVFNVGSDRPRTINELVELLGGDVIYLPKRPGEPNVTWADISKIKMLLGWEPKVTLEEGVKVMLEHLGDWKGERVWTQKSTERATREWFKYLR